MKCRKCDQGTFEEWVSGKTYEGIDIHHHPPKFMLNCWKGEFIPLCRKCHRELHDHIINIMFKHTNLFKKNKSDYWTWIKIIPRDRPIVIDEVINFTREWLNKEDLEDDTKAVTE